jgi:hypothetical protein
MPPMIPVSAASPRSNHMGSSSIAHLPGSVLARDVCYLDVRQVL